MKWLIRIVAALAALALVTVLAFQLFGEDIWRSVAPIPPVVPFAELKAPEAPNEFLVCPEEGCGRAPDLVSPVYAVPPDALLDAMASRLIRQAGVPLRLDDGTLLYTTHSPTFRFPDDVAVGAFPAEGGGSRIAIHAKARIGVDDMGANERRTREWLALLSDLERPPGA